MNKTRKRSFTVLLFVLVSLFALVLSLGILSACGNEETLSADENASSETWHYGAGDPADDIGVPGDHYLNTETLTSFVKEGKTWREATAEEAGSWYYGTSAPADKLGNVGDFFLNKETGELYHKSEGGWGTPVLTLKGVPGRDGVVWFSGTGEPDTEALKDPQAGDFYLKTDGFVVYQLQPDGTWLELGSIKGETGDDAKDPVQFYSGYGKPSAEITDQANEGDLYLGRFLGNEEENEGAGTRLYRYLGGEWKILVEDMHAQQLNIYTLGQLLDFAESAQTNDYAGKEVHLKTDIDFNEIEAASLHRALAARASEDWTPIGTSEMPFRGIFDGEGHKIENFSAKTTDSATAVGFFGHVENATIEHLHFVAANVEVSGSGAVGAVVVGQSKGVSFNDVTVTGNSTVKAESGATTGSLVGSSEGIVTVENVEVESKTEGTESGAEDTTLVGSGEVTFTGKNVVEYPISDGFVETHYKNDEDTTVIYEISNPNGLKYFRDSVNGTLKTGEAPNDYSGKNVALTDDIKLNNEPWTPIGDTESHSFLGCFDGRSKTISDLKIIHDSGTKDYLGLFGVVGNSNAKTKCVLENLTIKNVEIPASSHPTEENSHGDVSNLHNTGAFIGESYSTDLKNLTLVGDVYIHGNRNIGGIVGDYRAYNDCVVENITVDTTATSLIQADGTVGSVFGEIYVSTKAGTVTMSTIAITGVMVKALYQAGGVVGVIDILSTTSISIDDVKFTDAILVPFNLDPYDASKYDKFGVVAGMINKRNTTATISDVKGNVSVELDPTHSNSRKANMHYNGLVGFTTNNTLAPTITGENTLVINWYGLPYSVADGVWMVSTPDDMTALAALADGGMNFAGQTIKVMENISLAGIEWSSPDFSGVTFDGNDKTISDITCATDDENGVWRAGLFGHFNGTVKNLTLTNVTAKGAQVGALYGHSDGITLENVTVSGNINITYDAKHGETYPGIGVVGGINADNAAHAGSVTVAAACVATLVTKDFDSRKDTTYDSKYTATTQLVLGFVRYDLENFNKCITVEEGAQITYGVAKVGDTAYLSIKDAFAALTGEETLTLTLLEDASYEGASSSARGQLFTINANAIIDLNGKTLSLADTDENGSENCGLRVGASVTSLEIKNGHITYTKREHSDGTFALKCAFLSWTASGSTDCNLTFDHVEIDGNALYAKGTNYQHHLKVTVKNHCKMVSTKEQTFFLWNYVDFTATDSELGKMIAETNSGGITVTLTRCTFAGTDIKENGNGGFYNSVIFRAEDTTITGDIQFYGQYGEVDGKVIDDATFTGCSIGGSLVIGGDEWHPTKVTLTDTKVNKELIRLLDKKSTLTIDGQPYVAE